MISSRTGVAAAALAVAALAWAAAAGAPGASPAYVFTTTPRYQPQAWLSGADRFPAGAALTLVNGSKRQRIASGFAAAADPAVSFDGTKILFAGKRTAVDKWQIWETEAAGAEPRRIATVDADCIRPLYLPGGRIVYTRLTAGGSEIEIVPAQRLTHAPGRYLTSDVLRDGRILLESERELLTVYPDGTGVEALRCDHGAVRSGARQLASGDVLFTAGNRLARFTSALAKQTGVLQPDGEIAGPVAEIAAGKWIVAVKSAGRFGLVVWDSALKQATPLEAPPADNALQPVIVAPRVPPRDFPSALVPTRKTANLLCLDGRDAKSEARSVKLFTRASDGKSVALGQTPLAGDGSFYVEVPADRPLRLELLDAAGRLVGGERGWFWMRPSEQRICVGCHAGPERSPENRVPEILERSTVPVKMLGEAGS